MLQAPSFAHIVTLPSLTRNLGMACIVITTGTRPRSQSNTLYLGTVGSGETCWSESSESTLLTYHWQFILIKYQVQVVPGLLFLVWDELFTPSTQYTFRDRCSRQCTRSTWFIDHDICMIVDGNLTWNRKSHCALLTKTVSCSSSAKSGLNEHCEPDVSPRGW